MEVQGSSPIQSPEASRPPDQLAPVTTESAPRIGPQDAERAKQEKEKAFAKLMDDMEKSAETQGEYFVKIGQKKPITETRQGTTSGFLGMGKKPIETQETIGYDDTRALLLKAPVDGNAYGSDYTEFVVVTPDGLQGINFYKSELENPSSGAQREKKAEYDLLVALTTGKQTPDSSASYSREKGWDRTLVSTGAFNSQNEGQQRWPSYIRLTPVVQPGGQESEDQIFQKAVKESIAKTESPFKKQVEEATRDKQVAVSASSVINSLPPRT